MHTRIDVDQQIDRSRNSPADWRIRGSDAPGCGRIHEARSWRASSTRANSIQRRAALKENGRRGLTAGTAAVQARRNDRVQAHRVAGAMMVRKLATPPISRPEPFLVAFPLQPL